MKRLLPLALPLLGARVPIALLRGTAGFALREATVVTAGARPSVDDLPDRFFGVPPARRDLGMRAVWSLPAALKRAGTRADWSVARLDHVSSRLFFGRGFLRVPESVGSWLPVPDDPAVLARANHSVKEDLRIVRREQLQAELSRSRGDCDFFHRRMHVPFMQRRHGDAAVIRKLAALRRGVRRGGILFVRRGDERIAGVAFRLHPDTLELLAVGTLDGDVALVRDGALAAIYWFALRHARERRCARIDFGGASPVLSDGLLRYKRKWGVRLAAEPRTHYDYLVRWERPDSLLPGYLARNPLIFRQGSRLAGVAVSLAHGDALERHARELHRDFYIEGLGDFYVLAAVSEPRTLVVDRDAPVGAGSRIRVVETGSFMREVGLSP